MGKLLQKIVHGIVPSWLTRLKSSAHTSSPKLLLPPPTSSASNNIRDLDRSGQPSINDSVAPATCAEISVLPCSVDSTTPPSSMQHKNTNMQQKNGKHEHSDTDDQFEDNLHADMNDCSRGTYSPATKFCAPNQQPHEGIQDENNHPQNRDHRHQVERPICDHVLLGSEKRSPCIQCMQEDDSSHHHQKGYHEQPNAKHKRSYVGWKREIGRAQEDKQHNHKDYGDEADNGYGAARKNQRDLLGFKRKSRYSEEEKDEEEETGEGHGDRGWGGKRRKREEGLMSCELPESICGVVGNAKAVVKYSEEPQLTVWESMVEMIVGNGLWEVGSLEYLLFCYLSLNEPHLHSIIQSSFLQVLKDLERTF